MVNQACATSKHASSFLARLDGRTAGSDPIIATTMVYRVEPQQQPGYQHHRLYGSLRIRVEALETDQLDDVSNDASAGGIVYLGDRRVPRLPCYVDLTSSGALMGFRYAVELNADDDDENSNNDEHFMQRREEILGARNGTPRAVTDHHGRKRDRKESIAFRSGSLQ
ncbi:hypothetical protein CLOM_g3185 [Closterium sp. NIES-68]|nr:hypothetical protein CLOM_g3185 [Closterium sp. NIES-68]GJP64643.1 hypothetical protein CLOP_g21619 [Closterium sp. NIES-67]